MLLRVRVACLPCLRSQPFLPLRFFSTSRTNLYAGGIRGRLEKVVERGSIPVDKEALELKKKKLLMRKNDKLITGASAKRMVSELLGTPPDEFSEIGPDTKFTEEQMGVIFASQNKRLKYTVLGSEGYYFRNKFQINEKIKSFLEKDDLVRAKSFLSISLPQYSSGAFGTMIKYYTEKQDSLNATLDFVNWAKDRGIKFDARGLGLLLSGSIKRGQLTKSFEPITVKQAHRLMNVIHSASKTNPDVLSAGHIGGFVASCSGVLPPLEMKVFLETYYPNLFTPNKNKEITHVGKNNELAMDKFLLKRIFNFFSYNSEDFREGLILSENLFQKIQKTRNARSLLDNLVVTSYVSCLAKTNDVIVLQRAIRVIRDWFLVCSKEDIQKDIPLDQLSQRSLSKLASGFTSINPNFKDITYKLDTNNLPQEIYGFLMPEEDINYKKMLRFKPGDRITTIYLKVCKLLHLDVDPIKEREADNAIAERLMAGDE